MDAPTLLITEAIAPVTRIGEAVLTLLDSFRLGRVTLYRDSVQTGETRTYSSRFYALPDAPRVVIDDDGEPEFDFVWYRSPAGSATIPRAGGLVTITVDLGITDAERTDLTAGIRSTLPAEELSDLEIVGVPFLDGTVELTFGGEQAGVPGDLATTRPTPARLQGTQRATFEVELSRDGAALLGQLLEHGLDPFHARYDLTFAYRLDGVALRVWCDGRRAHDLAGQLGSTDATRLTDTMVEERTAGVELETTQVLPPAHRNTLEALGRRLLTAALAASLSGPYASEVESHLNHTFTQSTLLPQQAVLEDQIRLGRTLEQLGDRVRTVDLSHGFFATLDVAILCTVDFSRELIDSVHLTVTYSGVDEHTTGGRRIERSAEYVFSAGVGPQRFRTDLAGADQRAIGWRAEVRYRGDPQPVVIEQPPTETTTIVLDLDGSGVLDVSIGLRDPSWTDVSAVTVELEHPSTGHTARLVLDSSHPDGRWTSVIRAARGPLRYRAVWHQPDGPDVLADWSETAGSEIWLDQPKVLTARAAVELVAVGDFSALAQLLVELRPDPEAPVETFAFTTAGQEASWFSPGLEPGQLRYQSRQVLGYADGRRDELDWVDRDAPVLVVGDLLRFDVLIEPRLLDLGGAYKLGLLELEPWVGDVDAGSGPGQVPAPGTVGVPAATPSPRTETLVVRDRATPLRWSFRMRAPDRRDYRYRLTLLTPAGDRIVGSWREVGSSVLVLRADDT